MEINIEQLSSFVDNHIKNFSLKSFPLEKYSLENTINYIKLKKNDYCRNIIYRSKLFEIIIISWWQGSKTVFHNHPKNGCKLKVLFGKLQENLLLKDTEQKTKINILEENNTSYLDDYIGIHQIEALEPSVSLHIYSPPGFYDK